MYFIFVISKSEPGYAFSQLIIYELQNFAIYRFCKTGSSLFLHTVKYLCFSLPVAFGLWLLFFEFVQVRKWPAVSLHLYFRNARRRAWTTSVCLLPAISP